MPVINVTAKASVLGAGKGVNLRIEPDAGETLYSLARRALSLANIAAEPAEIILDGSGVSIADAKGWSCDGLAGSNLKVAGETGEVSTIVYAVLAVASAVASYALAPRSKVPTGSGDASERRLSFGRYSSAAIAGEPVQVVFGEVKKYGGKVIAQFPGEGEDGDQRLKVLISFGHGPIDRIGNQTADADGLAPDVVDGVYIQDRSIDQYPSARVSVRMGTENQRAIPGFDDVVVLREVGSGGVRLVNTSGSARTGSTASAEAVSQYTLDPCHAVTLRLRFPRGLYSVAGSGATIERQVLVRYQWAECDSSGTPTGGYSAWTVRTCRKAETGEVFVSPTIRVADGSNTPRRVVVRAERVSVDATNAADVDEVWFDSIVQRTDSAETYPGIALMALDLTAGDQLTGVPRVSADVRGYSKCVVYDTESPISAPEFIEQWSDNTAAAALTLMRSPVFGLGELVDESRLVLAEWAAAQVACDVTVPRQLSALGATRKMHTCNLVVGERKRGDDWVREILDLARCRLVTRGARYGVVYDGVRSNAAEVLTDDDIAADDSGAAQVAVSLESTRRGVKIPNRRLVQFTDMASDNRTNTVAWPKRGKLWFAGEDAEPVREVSERIDGLTDPEEAAAHAQYLVKAGRFRRRRLAAKLTKPLLACQPGDRFDLASASYGSAVATGLLAEGDTGSVVHLDQPVLLDAGVGYSLQIVHRDGTMQQVAVTAAPGLIAAGADVAIADDLAMDVSGTGPTRYAMCAAAPKAWILERLTPEVDDNNQISWRIEAAEYVPEVYQISEMDFSSVAGTTLRTNATPPGPVVSLATSERQVAGLTVLELSWVQAAEDRAITSAFRIYRRVLGTSTWVLLPELRAGRSGVQIPGTLLDRPYEFVVVAVTATGAALSPESPRHPRVLLAVGDAALPPAGPAAASISQVGGNLYRLSWDAVDGAATYQVIGRAAPDGGLVNGGAEDGQTVARTPSTSVDIRLASGLSHTFWVRAVGASGRHSREAASATEATPAAPAGRTVRATETINLTSSGTLTNLASTGGELVLSDRTEEGVFVSDEIDYGTVVFGDVMVRVLLGNDVAVPDIGDAAWAVPSIEADCWGMTDDGPPPVVGMLWPPLPDSSATAVVEVRTHDGSAWSGWAVVPATGWIEGRLIRKVQARVTLTSGRTPYAPRLESLALVVSQV